MKNILFEISKNKHKKNYLSNKDKVNKKNIAYNENLDYCYNCGRTEDYCSCEYCKYCGKLSCNGNCSQK